ncbi:GntR family transcriptional regulator [Niallia circulans]|uniref:GntR family transcriptional regulator n=2 Tax=Bacillaceae TaxID=186817 RepID=UPI00077C705F|nr:GntR family transcriptional regulator [Niallia circulans]MDR4318919.1 GntR family transcriptional regulator [Niallia circulans]MED3839681.1 GntR family transcriptional regulator [Niallia circulans]MED4245473.1 GntR family transcriptional regulator [Niallia circulans]MED4250402.1 GntR family transcriptional regulator [Niallia circulans]NRG32237.1 GntR family transcriptional regulator [Niallia circulans]
MYIQINPELEMPIYEQLTMQIMIGIIRQELQDGDVLPSVRSLAADLGVNMHTVNKSYHALEKKGLIQIIPKSGAIIRTNNGIPTQEEQSRISNSLKPMIVEALVIGMKEKEITGLIQSIIHKLKEE